MVAPEAGTAFRAIDPARTAENRADDYLVEMLRPTRISDNVQPIVGLFASANGLTEIEVGGNPS
jgi:hypothetical protein